MRSLLQFTLDLFDAGPPADAAPKRSVPRPRGKPAPHAEPQAPEWIGPTK